MTDNNRSDADASQRPESAHGEADTQTQDTTPVTPTADPRHADPTTLTGRDRSRANLVPFKKGKGSNRDPRAWTGGRPNTFEDFRKTLVEYLNTPTKKNKTRLTTIIDKMANTRGERKTLLEYAFGRVPATVDTDPSGKAMTWGEFVRKAMAANQPNDDHDIVDAEASEAEAAEIAGDEKSQARLDDQSL